MNCCKFHTLNLLQSQIDRQCTEYNAYRDDISEGGQRLVDISALFESVSRGPRAVCSLGSGQIYQVHHTALLGFGPRFTFDDLVKCNGDHCVGSTAGGVHVGGGHSTTGRSYWRIDKI